MSDSKLASVQRHIEELTSVDEIVSSNYARMNQNRQFNQEFEIRSKLEESRYQLKKTLILLRELEQKLKSEER